MKKLTILSILLISLAFVAPTQASAATSAGVKPDSFFYTFDLLGEKISLFLTRDPYEKAKKDILFADERIAEIKASGDNQKAALKATNEFTKDISLSFESFDKIKEDDKKVGFLVSFENRYKEHWGALSSLYDNLPQQEQPVFRENLVVYANKLQRSLDEVQNIMDKKSETKISDTGSDSKNVSDELADIKKQIALLIKQQSVTKTTPVNPSVNALKAENPQQYKNLVSENKSQLIEASKLLSNKNIISKVKPSVVFIETSTGSGSGIVIESNGYVLTNAHVVSSVNSATIKFSNGQSFIGTIVGRDENIDLALLKVNATNLTPATLGNSDSIEQGDSIFTFGYPLGIEGDVAFKDGTLSRRQKIDGQTYLEISAQILPGNSGGPLVNQSGEVIGVNTLALGASKIGGVLIGETLKYAIPINVAKGLIPELKNGRNVVTPKPSITIPTPYPVPNTPQPILPPSIFTPAPEQKPEPVRTTISNVKAEESSGGIVTISWNTNKVLAYSKILIGTDSQLNNAKEINGQSKWMTVLPSDYEYVPNTTYYYQVAIREYGSLNYDPIEVKSSILSFTTKKTTVDISVDVVYKSSSTIQIIVKSDVGVYATLSFNREDGQQSSYCGSPYSNLCSTNSKSYTQSREYIFEFNHLTIGATYSYNIKISGAIDFTKTGTFKAADPNDATEPSLSIEAKIQSDNATPIIWGDKAYIKVESNELSQFKVETGVKNDLSDATTVCNNLNDKLFGFGNSISCEIKNLNRGVEYFYRVTAKDPAGNSAVSIIKNFTIPTEIIQ